MELDYTRCPELAARFLPKDNRVAIVDHSDPKFSELEKRATGKVLVHHVEWLEPGATARHSTRIEDTTFDLALAVHLTAAWTYETDLWASRKQGAQLPAPVKPGTQLTAAERKGVQQANMSIRLPLQPGQSVAIGGLAKPSDTPKTRSGSRMLVLLIGLEKPQGARPSASAAHP